MLNEIFHLPMSQQPHDHSGDPVAPLTSVGTPFTYGVLGEDRITYASSADALLGTLIADYTPTNPDDHADEDLTEHYLAQGRRRTEYAYGVAVNNIAQAIIAGELTDDQEAQLQRSLSYSPPLTITELPEWDPPVPMLLVASPYLRDHLAPPAGNVVMLDPTTPETMVHSLAEAGVINLLRHAVAAAPAATSTLAIGDPEPDEVVAGAIADLDMLLSNLEDPGHLPHHRSSIHTVAARLRTWSQTDSLTEPLDAIDQAGDDPAALTVSAHQLRTALVQLQTAAAADAEDAGVGE